MLRICCSILSPECGNIKACASSYTRPVGGRFGLNCEKQTESKWLQATVRSPVILCHKSLPEINPAQSSKGMAAKYTDMFTVGPSELLPSASYTPPQASPKHPVNSKRFILPRRLKRAMTLDLDWRGSFFQSLVRPKAQSVDFPSGHLEPGILLEGHTCPRNHLLPRGKRTELRQQKKGRRRVSGFLWYCDKLTCKFH